MRLLAAATVSSVLSLAAAQMTIQVGAEMNTPGGIFQFIPNNMTATNGSVVTFQFVGAPGNHSVTQSTFNDPCNPMAGGFDSGWVLIPDANSLSGVAPPTFNITITNATQPIWFFCKQLLPSPHCNAGMVGAINPPTSGNTLAAFMQKAQSFQGTPGQGQGGLVGPGASASALAGPIPSGLTLFTGSAVAASGSGSGSATGSATGTAASGTNSATSPSNSAGSSGALQLTGSTFSVVLAALLGYIIA